MRKNIAPKVYPANEEKFNVLSHALGFLLSVIALFILIYAAATRGNVWHIVSFSIYGLSMIMLYAASTFFHNCKNAKLRYRLNIFDHSSIYILIAGTYTPFALVTLNGTIGWVIFGIIWGLAITGVILKLFFIGRYRILSTAMYIFMGWIIVFAIKPLVDNLETGGLIWLFAGGVSYTMGAVFYSINRMKFNHAIFHVFVLLGSICHFISIINYVLP